MARPKYPDRRTKGFMIARYEILRLLVMDSPQTASQLWRGVPLLRFRSIYQRLHQLENAGYVKRVGKARRNEDYFPKFEVGGWGILWAVTEKGERFYWDYIDPNYKEGLLIRA